MKNKHTFFSFGYNGFFNGRATTSQLYPFNINEMERVDETVPLYRTCLFDRAVKTGNAMKFIPGIARAIQRLLYADYIGGEDATSLKGFGGYGYTDDGMFVAEYWDGNSETFNKNGEDFWSTDYSKDRRIVVSMDKDWNMSAICIDEYGGEKPYRIQLNGREKDAHSASAAIYAILANIVYSQKNGLTHDSAFALITAHYDQLRSDYDEDDIDAMIQDSHVLENDLYALIQYDENVNDIVGGGLDASKYNNPNINPLNLNDIKIEKWIGDSATFSTNARKAKTKLKPKEIIKTVKEFVSSGEFVLNKKRILTEDEAAMVPNWDNAVPEKEVLTKMKLITGSTFSPRPFRNVLWEGETGTGKTTAAQYMAQMLNLPYCFITINPDTLVSDLYVNILPNNKTQNSAELSSIMELAVVNPEEAYFKLTGTRKNVTTSEVIAEAMKGGSDFMYVESPLVQAFRYGWLCEIQEVNLAMKPGVFGGINAALDDLATIQLPTGEVVKRHPDTVIVATYNNDYEGTRRLNQAFISRMTLKGRFELPEPERLALRISQNSGLSDQGIIKKMLKVMDRVRKLLVDSGETNGACSVREIQAWAQATDILGCPHEAGMATIVPSASNDPEVLIEVKQLMETEFPDPDKK